MKSVLLDEIVYVNGNLELLDEKDKYWGETNRGKNKAIQMYDYLRKKGRLDEVCEYTAKHICKRDGAEVINLVIDCDKLSDEFIEEMEALFPGNGLKKVKEWSPCRYSGVKGLISSPHRSYRDWFGTNGSTFEHPYVQGFYPPTLMEFAKIRDEKGPVEAAIAVIKTCWDEEGGCKRVSTEEYYKMVDELYEEWEKEA